MIHGGGVFDAAFLGGGSLTNGSSANDAATIISPEAVNFLSAPGTVTNDGTITGTNATLSGVRLNFGGTVSNASGPLLTGQDPGVLAIAPNGQPLALVQNAGTIIGAGPNGEGVNAFGAMVDNTTGGLISGNASGIELKLAALVGGGAPPRLGGLVQNGAGVAPSAAAPTACWSWKAARSPMPASSSAAPTRYASSAAPTG